MRNIKTFSIFFVFVVTMISMSTMAFGIGDIMSIDVAKPLILLPEINQTVHITLSKPLVVAPKDMKVKLSIQGKAIFENDRKDITIDFSNVNWSDGIVKKIEKNVGVFVSKDAIVGDENVTILGNLTFFNELFGYQKTNLSSESTSVSFETRWKIGGSDEIGVLRNIAEDYDELNTNYEDLKEKYDKLVLEKGSMSQRVVDLESENQRLTKENNENKVDGMKLNVYKYSSVSLLVLAAILTSLIVYYRSKR